MTGKLLLIVTTCSALYAADTSSNKTSVPTHRVIFDRRELAMNVLSTDYKDLGKTIDDIEKVEDALQKSHFDIEQLENKLKKLTQATEIATHKKLNFNIREAIRFLQSARKRLDIAEEKLNPIYWEPPTVGFVPDFSYDTLMKSEKYPKDAVSKTLNITPQKTYKLIIALFIMSLLF